MSLNAIRVIFFDAVGTLIHPEPSAVAVYADVGRRFGSRHDVAAIEDRFRSAFARQEEYDRQHCYRTDHGREVRRWQTIVAEVLDDVPDTDACFQTLFDYFGRHGAWRCTSDAELVLRKLLGQGYRLGLASNFDKRLHAVHHQMPELWPLRHRVVSAEVGWRKPHPRFFQHLAEIASVTPDQILVVGDDFANDYKGATAAGLSAVHYDPQGTCSDGATVRIAALSELLALLPPIPEPG